MSKVPIVAIIGRTNVGKSSIFNLILQHREAIVAIDEGTTRDTLMGQASYNHRNFWIVDTAGMKDPADDFEATIQEQIVQAVDSADIIWVVIEANVMLTAEDRIIATKALKSKKPVFLVVNKSDKVRKLEISDYQRLGIKNIFPTSVTHGSGFIKLLDDTIAALPRVKFKIDPNIIKVAIIGRPNVGKSFLFNTLLNKQQAIVSAQAGTTRDVNKMSVRYEGLQIQLMDTAGIRRSGQIGQGLEHFSLIRTLAAIEEADVCLLLMDVNELNVQLDQKIAGMVKDANKGLILVVTKWDSYKGKNAFEFDYLIPQIKQSYEFVPWASVIFTSAVSGQNVTKLFSLIKEIAENRKKKIKTPELNRWLKQIIIKHPPAGLKNRNPKLNYMIQEQDSSSPNFKIYGSHAKYLHWSYKRFMEKELRNSFGFEGAAIKLWFFEKHIDRIKAKLLNKTGIKNGPLRK